MRFWHNSVMPKKFLGLLLGEDRENGKKMRGEMKKGPIPLVDNTVKYGEDGILWRSIIHLFSGCNKIWHRCL